MSWLYSLFIAGVLFSGEEARLATIPADEPIAAAVQTEETEKFERSYPLNSGGRVSVSNVNGSIVVEAWDRNEVKLEAIKRADTRERLSEVDLVIESDPSRFSVETEYKRTARHTGGWNGAGKNRQVEVEFKLFVPRGAVLDEVETVNGSVTVSDFTNVTKVSAVNGDVSATKLRGAVDLSTVNGEVKCDVESIDPGSKVSLSTVNGRVVLAMPSDVSATVKADTLNGSITNDLGLPVRKGEYVGRDLYGRIGSGDAQIKLDSVNGPIIITRKNDGRAPNPVTDLLPQTGRTDGVSINDKVNRSIDRSVRMSQREAVAAARRAQVEMDKIKPALEKMKLEKLDKLKIDIDEKAIERSVADAMRAQGAVFARMREANWMTSVPRIERKTNTLKVSGTPTIKIDAKDCDVAIRGWDKGEVKYTLTEITSGAERPDADVKETSRGGNIGITVTGTEGSAAPGLLPAQHRYRLEIYVPVRSDITVVSEGEIRVNGVKGSVDISGSDGSVDVREGEGRMKIAARDGQIRVVGFHGSLDVNVVDSPVYLDGEFSSLATTMVDGSIILALPESPNVTLRSNRPIVTEHPGAEDKDGVIRFGSGAAIYKFEGTGGSIIVRRSALIVWS